MSEDIKCDILYKFCGLCDLDRDFVKIFYNLSGFFGRCGQSEEVEFQISMICK